MGQRAGQRLLVGGAHRTQCGGQVAELVGGVAVVLRRQRLTRLLPGVGRLRQGLAGGAGALLPGAQVGVLQVADVLLGLAQRGHRRLRVGRVAHRLRRLVEVLDQRLALSRVLARPRLRLLLGRPEPILGLVEPGPPPRPGAGAAGRGRGWAGSRARSPPARRPARFPGCPAASRPGPRRGGRPAPPRPRHPGAGGWAGRS